METETNEQTERDLKSLKFELQEEHQTADNAVTTAFMLDLAALLRTGKATHLLTGVTLTLEQRYYTPSLLAKLPTGEKVRVSFERMVEQPDVEREAREAYEAGRRPKRQRDW